VKKRRALAVISLFRENRRNTKRRSNTMKMRKKFLDYEYEKVLDVKTRELIRVACAVAVGCPD